MKLEPGLQAAVSFPELFAELLPDMLTAMSWGFHDHAPFPCFPNAENIVICIVRDINISDRHMYIYKHK